ncbi:hypothetical protein VSU19_07855 [Verrucomicrobiales bacterium BCK34]|nr:hypothetical protein [Verrucomicrobiales bacterium BCK34]
MNLTLEEAIERLRLPTLTRRLGIPGEIPECDGKPVRCFFPDRHVNGDRKPSFNFYKRLTTFKCHACGIDGRGPDLISMVLGLGEKESIHRFIEMAGGISAIPQPTRTKAKTLRLPNDHHAGKEEDWMSVASSRRIDAKAIALASRMGILKFGHVLGFYCWIVTDEAQIVAEARRMDGKPFPPIGSLGARKAHTLAGSKKMWPAGLMPAHSDPRLFKKIALVEGGPDLLAAFHFLIEQGDLETLPIAMLGRSCKTIHPEALRLLKERRIRIFPHNDEDGGGFEAAKHWSKTLQKVGIQPPSAFSFAGLLQADGTPVSDLNDCTTIQESDKPAIEGLFSYE